MRNLLTLLLIAVFVAGCRNVEVVTVSSTQKQRLNFDQSTAATVSGSISFEGAVPKAQQIDMSQDPACVMGVAPNFAQVYQVSKEGKLANVYIYIKQGLEQYAFDPPKESLVIDQNGCRYVPHVAVAMVGQTVRIKNSDNALHNVHPSPVANKAFNISQQPHGDDIEKAFTEGEVMMPVKCNQHPWMKMYLNISPHPFFAVSGTDGTFEISRLPPGEYTLAAVHERLGEKTVKLKVGAKESAKADFTFRATDAK
jgi:plastocyanin